MIKKEKRKSSSSSRESTEREREREEKREEIQQQGLIVVEIGNEMRDQNGNRRKWFFRWEG